MHLYWRILEELRYLGEVLIFHDPSISREYEIWMKKKAKVLPDNSEDDVPSIFPSPIHIKVPPSLN
ncbi:MAG: hypothetical protein SV775_10630 [Thermodesulfobacteriota bacterium]|nr:hypothetical protein [Thermodesulfobacteriota bacterium]